MLTPIDTLRKKLAAPGTRSISLTRKVGRALLDELQPPHPAEGMKLTFEETWREIDPARWSTVYRWNSLDYIDHPSVRGSSQYQNGEKGWNINRAYGPTLHLEPWQAEDGKLVLTADRTPPDLKPYLGYDQPDARNLADRLRDALDGVTHDAASQI